MDFRNLTIFAGSKHYVDKLPDFSICLKINTMDTDELSDESYYGVIGEAETFLHELTLHFGVLASSCEDEDEYLQSALKLVDRIRKADPDMYEDIFWGENVKKDSLLSVLKNIEQNIIKTRRIPIEERNFTRW